MMNNSLESGECIKQELTLDAVSEIRIGVDHLTEWGDVAPYRKVFTNPNAPLRIRIPKVNIHNQNLEIPEHTSEYKMRSDFPVKHSTNVKLATNLPLFSNMRIRVLKTPFNKGNAILLLISNLATPAANVREAFKVVYTLFQSMTSDLTFQCNKKYFRCRGYYTKDFYTCTFEAQI